MTPDQDDARLLALIEGWKMIAAMCDDGRLEKDDYERRVRVIRNHAESIGKGRDLLLAISAHSDADRFGDAWRDGNRINYTTPSPACGNRPGGHAPGSS